MTVTSVIPPGSVGLEVLIGHQRAAREPLRNAGEVAFRVHASDLPLELSGLAPNGMVGPGIPSRSTGPRAGLTVVQVPHSGGGAGWVNEDDPENVVADSAVPETEKLALL